MIKRELFEGDSCLSYVLCVGRSDGGYDVLKSKIGINEEDSEYCRYFELDLNAIELPPEPRELEVGGLYRAQLKGIGSTHLRYYHGDNAPVVDSEGRTTGHVDDYEWGPKQGDVEEIEGW